MSRLRTVMITAKAMTVSMVFSIELQVICDSNTALSSSRAATAEGAHFATELVVRFAKDRRAYPAICLASDGGLLTAAANDYGFDEIFARQVAAFGQPGDVLICLTTSGKSKNVKRALEEAKMRKLKTIGFLGRGGGSTTGIADVELLIRGDSIARIQEAHQLLLHVLCEVVESHLDES